MSAARHPPSIGHPSAGKAKDAPPATGDDDPMVGDRFGTIGPSGPLADPERILADGLRREGVLP